MGQIENLVDKMRIEKQVYPSKCCNKNCQNSDDSGSGCLRYSKWTVDMCGEFHSGLNLLLCRCGCGKTAKWLISGYSPEGEYKDEPACELSASYVEACAYECNCTFYKRSIAA